MKIPPSPDRETFQHLLANASANQEDQINSESLSAAMDLHLDGAMRYIVESTQKVANAAGVGMALLKRDRLTYRAGIGSCANYVGLRVAASLTVSTGEKTYREILRVENAHTDTRIEADVCRQFGANALLILPIYHDGAVAGVLDVRFNEAHIFDDQELGAYRSLAEQVEVVLTRAVQLEHQQEQNENRATTAAPIPDATPAPAAPEQVRTPELNQIRSPEVDEFAPAELEETAPVEEEEFMPAPAFMMLPQNEHSLYARCEAVFADIMQMAIFKQAAGLVTTLSLQAKKLSSPRRRPASTVVVTRKFPIFMRPTLPAALLAQRAKILTLPARGRNSAHAAAQEFSSVLKSSASFANMLGQRAKNVVQRLLRTAQAAAHELFIALRKSASRTVERTQLPDRWRNSAQAVATELSSVLKRTSSSAATLPQRKQNLTFLNRWRNFAQAMAAEFSAILKRAGSSATRLTQRAQNFTLPVAWRNATVTTVAVVLAFIAGIVYKSQSPAKSLESSTLPNASSTEQPAPVPKPAAAKPAAAVQPAPVPLKTVVNARNTPKRVRASSNEVDYIGDDVTVRTFTYNSPTKRARAAAGRTAQYGDDVTVRYFGPAPSVTKTAAR